MSGSSYKRAMSIALVAIMLTASFAGLTGTGEAKSVSQTGINGLTSHAPIRIDNDTDFANQATSEGWNGSGTVADPYIIENYDINGTGHGYCLYIGNTTSYFVVRNCSLHEANGNPEAYYWNSGIVLYNIRDGAIVSNNASNNDYGIYICDSSRSSLVNNTLIGDGISIEGDQLSYWNTHVIDASNRVNGRPVYYWKNTTGGKVPLGAGEVILANCSNVVVQNQNVSNGSMGMVIAFSDGITIANNTANSNNEDGIWLYFSSNNTITNNTANSNKGGIFLESSASNIIANNTFVKDGLIILGDHLSYWNTHVIDASNTVNGGPVYYWKNTTGGKVPLGAGEVILANCSNVVVQNQNVSNGSIGMEIAFSDGITIANNTANSNKQNGIHLYSSSSTIKNNTANLNNEMGIYLTLSDNNTITNNTALNNMFAIVVYKTDNNTINNNTANSNSFYGIYIGESGNNTIANNTAISNMVGILLYNASSSTITNNTAISNLLFGIQLYNASSSIIANNNVSNANYYGIYIGESSNNTIINNTASDDGAYGIYLNYASNNTLINNTASKANYGIYLTHASNNTIIKNTLSWNDYDGISIWHSSNNTIINNFSKM